MPVGAAAGDPVIIVGAGLSGAGAAWSLARRGVPVLVLEQHDARHEFGSSHGSARIVRRAYADPFYAAATGRAFELWHDIEHTSGTSLIRFVGALDFGGARSTAALVDNFDALGIAYDVLDAAAATRRWPGMAFEGDVLWHRQAGVLDASLAVDTLLALAQRAGARVRFGAPVTEVDDHAVRLADGTALAARAVVVAAGGWLAPLLAGRVELPRLQVTRQSVFHFPRRSAAEAAWPSTIHERAAGAVYHLAGGRDGGSGDDRKIGLHDPGPEVLAGRPGEVDPTARAAIVDYVREWLPGLVPEPRGETTCLYTRTPGEDFLLDRTGDVIICSPCSGHGAKFAPLVGEWVTQLIAGGSDGEPVPDRFRLAAHHESRGTAASL